MALQADQIADIVQATQRELGRFKFTEIASELQDHVGLSRLFRRERASVTSGEQIQFEVMTTHSGAAKNNGLFEVDDVNVGDVLQKGVVPWRHSSTNYAFEKREVSINRTPARIVDLVRVRRTDAMVSFAELAESNVWSKPDDSSDTTEPFGVPYWIVKNATEGFNGGNPTGFSSGAGGIDSATYTRWKNWTAQYTQVSRTDFIRKARQAAVKTRFKPPVNVPDFNTGNKYGFFTNYDVIQTLEESLENQNDNLGNDIASKDGQTMFRRVPVTWVPKLDTDTSDPFYGINFGVFRTEFLAGEFGRESRAKEKADEHNTMVVFVDWSYNFVCRNRRLQFVLYK